MDIMHNYSDLLTEIEVIKDQIKITESQIDYWWIGNVRNKKIAANTSIEQTEKLVNSLDNLRERLDMLERAKTRVERLMQQFEGLDYKIAYKRIIECRTHAEIADELGYTEQYIRKRWMDLKSTNSQQTS